MEVDSNLLQIKDVNYVKPLKCLMVKATNNTDVTMKVFELEYADKVKEVFAHVEEELIYFLNK